MSTNPVASTAKKPDKDWSQVRETINMLTLAMSQVECTMTDGEKSVTELESIKISAAEMHQQIMSAIIAFQFYDRLTQRLDHVKRELGWLSSLVSDPQQLYNPLAWSKLQEHILSNYTMEEERIMFQHTMNGQVLMKRWKYTNTISVKKKIITTPPLMK